MKLAITAAVVLLALPAFAGGVFDDDCRYTSPRNASTSAVGVTKVVIRADAGSLDVSGLPGATEIAVRGTACSSDEDFLSRINVTMRKVGSELRIETQIPEKTVIFGFFTARLDLQVSIPAGVPVEVDDSSGWIKVSTTGALTINDDSGSIQVRDVRGPLVISDDSGSIEVVGVIGNVTIEDDSGEIRVRNVRGNVVIEDDSGAIIVSRIEGSVHVRNDDSGSISIEHVRGDVAIDEDSSGSVTVSDIGGNFTVGRKSSGHIDHSRVSGQVRIPERR